MKIVGLSMVPWGEPTFIMTGSDMMSSIMTTCCHFYWDINRPIALLSHVTFIDMMFLMGLKNF